MNETVELSKELLDHVVDALTHLPYRQVQDVFSMLAHELATQEEPATDEDPQLIVR